MAAAGLARGTAAVVSARGADEPGYAAHRALAPTARHALFIGAAAQRCATADVAGREPCRGTDAPTVDAAKAKEGTAKHAVAALRRRNARGTARDAGV